MACVHLRRLYQLCQNENLRLSGSDLIRIVCQQCGVQEVCPSVLIEQLERTSESSAKPIAAEPSDRNACDATVPRESLTMPTHTLLIWAMLSVLSLTAYGQMEFESPPIDYAHAPTNDPVTRLQKQIDAGQVKLHFDEKHGYLPAVLEQLGILGSSQMLVASQTSFQLRKISPQRPRAIYFNDDVYVGWVQFGDVMELSSVDPRQGAVFYTLEQSETARPKFVRDQGQCLICHASSRTQNVPGHLVRSVFADRGGVPLLGSGTFTTSHRSPFDERWGGWYVTGTHGDQRHMGNVFIQDKSQPDKLDREAGANVTDLGKVLDVSPYFSEHSDIVALMVLEHQTQMHNALTRANFETRLAEHHDQIMNQALNRPADYRSETTQRRIAAAGDNVLKHLLFADEYQLTSPVQGTSTFASDFVRQGPTDLRGRSLREFDLQQRLFKYPCSFLIYSKSFDHLPRSVKNHVFEGLQRVLTGEDRSEDFRHLCVADRKALLEILSETKPECVKADSASMQ